MVVVIFSIMDIDNVNYGSWESQIPQTRGMKIPFPQF